MRLPDLNVLIYAIDATSPQHERARSWLEQALSSREQVGFSTVVMVGFVRLTTNPRIVLTPMVPAESVAVLADWLHQPCALQIHPGSAHLGILSELLAQTGSSGNLVNDAHLAALAIEHSATLASFDGDFHRFKAVDLQYLG